MSMFEKAVFWLQRIRPVFPSAIVAGGYLRDLTVGATPKDIDVFIGSDERDTPTMEADLTRALGVKVVAEYNLSYANMEVLRVFTTTPADLFTPPVQIIELDMKDPVERIQQHDFGLCQIWHDGAQLHTTGHFEWDLQWKRCTLVHCENAKEHQRSMRRWERLKVKLEPLGYTLRDRTEWVEAPCSLS